jgi:hypothetical protein
MILTDWRMLIQRLCEVHRLFLLDCAASKLHLRCPVQLLKILLLAVRNELEFFLITLPSVSVCAQFTYGLRVLNTFWRKSFWIGNRLRVHSRLLIIFEQSLRLCLGDGFTLRSHLLLWLAKVARDTLILLGTVDLPRLSPGCAAIHRRSTPRPCRLTIHFLSND